jgi:hypothetical protein
MAMRRRDTPSLSPDGGSAGSALLIVTFSTALGGVPVI